ncbi:hypothetical protein E3T55_14940 [Cryobacterium frigoriphilum]|uniref:Lipoprotein n=2 Tax=Cryobacterium frigoriphilum TaxID=1259150 RepID=A0A4R8ZW88_9MICO|nr:hypothetical protein E3T55_14940 [Cryobacterium frigoriphilum]
MFRTSLAIGVVGLAAIGLTGCAGDDARDAAPEPRASQDAVTEPEDALAVFTQPQAAQDLLPDSLPATAFEDIDRDTTRLLWADGDTSYYAATSPEWGTCLLVYGGEMPTSSCTEDLPVQSSTNEGQKTTMFADSLPDYYSDWDKVADHLWRQP